MTSNIRNILKCVCVEIMSKRPDNSGKAESHTDKLLDDSSDEEGTR